MMTLQVLLFGCAFETSVLGSANSLLHRLPATVTQEATLYSLTACLMLINRVILSLRLSIFVQL